MYFPDDVWMKILSYMSLPDMKLLSDLNPFSDMKNLIVLKTHIKTKAIEIIQRNMRKCKQYHKLNHFRAKHSYIYLMAISYDKKFIITYPEFFIWKVPRFMGRNSTNNNMSNILTEYNVIPKRGERTCFDVIKFLAKSPMITLSLLEIVGW